MVVVQSIVINKPSSVVFDFLKYARNQEQFSVWNMKDPNKETQTSVTWDFRGPTKFPMSLFSGLISKMLGKDIAQSLTNLKNKLEQ